MTSWVSEPATAVPHLNERQRRLAQEARLPGHGGVRTVARMAGVSETTVPNGVFELEAGEDPLPAGCVRRPGGGRKPTGEQDPSLVPVLLKLVEPDERGNPMSPLRWTTKSLRNLAEELTRQGHPVSAPTVGRLLKEQGFSLQASAKTPAGGMGASPAPRLHLPSPEPEQSTDHPMRWPRRSTAPSRPS